jgi:hypothetical protein
MRIRLFLLEVAVCLLLWPAPASAQKAACTEAYEQAQEEKASGHFKTALSHLRACVAPECPRFIREDCARWMDQAEAATPTVVFAVRRNGVDQTEVDVTCDGQPLTHSLDGKALALDPGMHTFLFSIPGLPSVERPLLIREGEHNRLIEVEFQGGATPVTGKSEEHFASPISGIPSAERSLDAQHSTSRPYLMYGLAGTGVLGIAGFSAFALLGSSQQGDLEKSCSPNCRTSQVDSVKTKYLVADVCLGVGLVSLGVATYLFFSTPSGGSHSDKKPEISIDLVPRPGGEGGVLRLSKVF